MRAARRDLPALTRLWQACFGDTEAEVRAFWQALFDCTPVYLRRAPDSSPAAMLCALPAELVGDDGDAVPAAYLYAVCTAPALRGRGHCRLLLQEAEQDLAKQDVRAAVLVPAEESLFGFYARFGYRTVFTCRTETVPAARGDCSITPLTPDGWQSLRELQLYDSHLSYPPELLRWQETISRSSGAGLYRIETGDAVCCAAAERDGETLLVRELLPDCPEAAAALADKLAYLQNAVGGVLDPFSSFLTLRGIRTLSLRVEKHSTNALAIAQWLEQHRRSKRYFIRGWNHTRNIRLPARRWRCRAA